MMAVGVIRLVCIVDLVIVDLMRATVGYCYGVVLNMFVC